MKIMIDIGHPGHVHLFKNFAWEMEKRGHTLFFTCREKEFEIELLKTFGFKFKSFGRKYNSRFGKLWGLVEFDVKEFITGLRFKPDLLLSVGSMYAAHAAFLLRKPHIALEDTGNMEQVRLYKPFTKAILVPEMFHKNLGKKQIRYNGLHELFYLHPNYFKPDKIVYTDLGISEDQEYVIMRLVSWNASHDQGQSKRSNESSILSMVEKIIALNIQVFISSEAFLPESLNKYKIRIKPERLHDALAYAKLYIGEGGTTATEASLLGTPSIIINEQAKFVGVHQKLQNQYELQYFFDNIKDGSEKILNMLAQKNLKEIWDRRRADFLSNNIDPTEFLLNFILHKYGSK
jgi:uncharacterized protein